MRQLMQPSKKDTRPFFRIALGVMILGILTGQIWLFAISIFPVISWGGVLADPEAPEE